MSFIPVSPPPTPSGPTNPGILAPSALIAALSSLLSPQTGSLTHLVQSLSVLLSASATGASLSLSFLLVPRLLESPTPLMLTQWRRAYEQTFSTLNRAGAAAALGYFLLAWRFGVRYTSNVAKGGMQALKLVKRGRMYAVAGALLVLGMAPYGWVVLGGVERRLVARAGAVERAMAQKGVDVEAGELGAGGSGGGLKRRQSVRGKSSTKEREKGTDRDGKGKGKEREREKEREVKEEGASREEGDVEAGLGEKVDMKAVEIGAKYWVDQWGVLNLGRAAMIAASAVMGLSASLWN
ncbi:hypothetical protein QBC32DRAFT_222989 [Pseudoneurospora amorphoporcata]|uniref:Uncharacterized protein n=1 Tax=Pseudoneurospora amorphoporcata TaxID=241081 RepID=A0AAN6NLC7_9PEZI|nr:hypothetical protein QBC32DRAFT_222989 [Pseudoneurospora amorphoporcata]